MLKKNFSCVLIIVLVTIFFVSCDTLRENRANVADAAINLAQRYIDDGNFNAAANVYKQAKEKTDDYRISYNLALVLAQAKRYDEALKECEYAMKKYPEQKDEVFMKSYAEYLRLAGETEKAADVYRQLIDRFPDDDDTAIRINYINFLFECNMDKKAYDEALYLWQIKIYKQDEHKKKDARTVAEFLYRVKPEEWEAVYKTFNSLHN
ncbi:MAG: tetratricopeptide repeat protein [Sphaerochaetaceae bacterium]|nr:tetratricopeptide repeat protein [Sphaerochaetaceae bacterium]